MASEELKFGQAPTGNSTSYPKNSYDGQEDQSYGFVNAFKLQTGNTRGTQTVGYGKAKIDGANNRFIVEANSTRVAMGDTSQDDDVTGIAITDVETDRRLIVLGKDSSSSGETAGLNSYDSDGTRRLLSGTYPDGSVKIKLSQPGYDVATATDDQLIWSSDFNMFKIVKTNTIAIPSVGAPSAGSQNTADTEVDTGIVSPLPLAVSAYIVSSGYSFPLPYMQTQGSGIGFYSGITQEYRAYTRLSTTGTVIFGVRVVNSDLSATPATSVKYYLMKETSS